MRRLRNVAGLRVDLTEVERIQRTVEWAMSMLASHPRPDGGPSSPVPANASQRLKVNLVAQVEPAVPGVTVYFKVWDVDDPFDQLYGPSHAAGVEEVPGVSTLDPGTDERLGDALKAAAAGVPVGTPLGEAARIAPEASFGRL